MKEPELARLRQERLRALPSVDEALRVLGGYAGAPRARLIEAVRAVLAAERRAVVGALSVTALRPGPVAPAALLDAVRARLDAAAAWRLDRVVNATGVVLHTNLGRALLAPAALARLALVARHYSNL